MNDAHMNNAPGTRLVRAVVRAILYPLRTQITLVKGTPLEHQEFWPPGPYLVLAEPLVIHYHQWRGEPIFAGAEVENARGRRNPDAVTTMSAGPGNNGMLWDFPVVWLEAGLRDTIRKPEAQRKRDFVMARLDIKDTRALGRIDVFSDTATFLECSIR